MATIEIRRKKFLRDVERRLVRNMRDITRVLAQDARRRVSRRQPVRVSASGRLVGLRPSAPGESPKRVSDTLHRAIRHEAKVTRKEIVGRFGVFGAAEKRRPRGSSTSVGRYAAMLEFGTSRMAARPWLRPTYRKFRKQIVKRLQATSRGRAPSNRRP